VGEKCGEIVENGVTRGGEGGSQSRERVGGKVLEEVFAIGLVEGGFLRSKQV
jgi:hypothetical protein